MKLKIFLIIIVIIISGCGVELKTWPPSSPDQCDSFSRIRSRDFKYDYADCYSYFAEKTGDVELCKKINEVHIANGVDIKEECFIKAAVAKKDVMICQELKNTPDCIIRVAQENDDLKLCDNIKNSVKRHNCFYKCGDYGKCGQNAFITIDNQQMSIFFGNVPGDYKEESCSYLFGPPTKDFIIKQGCNDVFSKAKVDPSICEKSIDNLAKDRCYYFYALYYAEEEYCNKLKDTYPQISPMGEILKYIDKQKCLRVVQHFKK